ncbi:MAG: Zn-dependent alcohol dehydrogenase [Hyphomicrobiales bacterium]|nr:Zn-dependent alcohol dehydrogenase [Hyphomicrobiales bacterium]
MKAAVLTEINQPLQILDLTLRAPRAGEARVSVKAAGVCMSDWHMIAGDWPSKPPLVLGHEAAGIVTEVGPGPSLVAPGDHVIFSFSSHCGHCRFCNAGRSIMCNGHTASPQLLPDGSTALSLNGEPVGQMARIGTFCEEVVCSTENLVPVRKDLPFPIAALIGCSVATGIGAVVRHARVAAGSSVVVIGCGGVGLNIIQGARLAGASKIIGVDLLDEKLEWARKFGATHVVNGKTAQVAKEVRKLTGGGADYAFDAIGAEATVAQIVDCVGAGGRAVMVGIPSVQTRAPVPPATMVWQEKTLSGSYYGSIQPDRDFPMIADLYMDKRIDLDSLVARTYRLEEINEGFAALRAGAAARGVVVFD